MSSWDPRDESPLDDPSVFVPPDCVAAVTAVDVLPDWFPDWFEACRVCCAPLD